LLNFRLWNVILGMTELQNCGDLKYIDIWVWEFDWCESFQVTFGVDVTTRWRQLFHADWCSLLVVWKQTDPPQDAWTWTIKFLWAICKQHSPPPSSQGDLGAAPSGLHLSARSMLPWLVSIEAARGSGEAAPAAPELKGAVIPFLLTTFRKAVLPIFWRWRVKASSTCEGSNTEGTFIWNNIII